VFEEGRYRINPQFRVEFDALQFEAAVRSARDATALQRALERYRGDFLKDAGAGDWHVELQERWRQIFEKAVSKKLHF